MRPRIRVEKTLKVASMLKRFLRCKQYKTKLNEWGYEKNIKETDMKAIFRKDLKRKADDPLRPSTFRVRGRPVPQPKIDRYKRDQGFSEDLATVIDAGKVVVSSSV